MKLDPKTLGEILDGDDELNNLTNERDWLLAENKMLVTLLFEALAHD